MHAPTNENIYQAVEDAVRLLGTNQNSFCFLLPDATPHTAAAGTTLKFFILLCLILQTLLIYIIIAPGKSTSRFHDVGQVTT